MICQEPPGLFHDTEDIVALYAKAHVLDELFVACRITYEVGYGMQVIQVRHLFRQNRVIQPEAHDPCTVINLTKTNG